MKTKVCRYCGNDFIGDSCKACLFHVESPKGKAVVRRNKNGWATSYTHHRSRTRPGSPKP